jgi:cytochrome c oxidase cbb3-type subunit 3
MADEKDELLNHNYDGIQEYNNPLPGWWLTIFLSTIIFSFIYWLHYEFGGGPTLNQELQMAQNVELEKQKLAKSLLPPSDNSNKSYAELIASADMKSGESVYTSRCASCHADQLQGLIGPNLTDNFWIHGKGDPDGIAEIVNVGVLEKGMPAWEAMLKPEEVVNVVAYVHSKIGSNPKNPKAPQGKKY